MITLAMKITTTVTLLLRLNVFEAWLQKHGSYNHSILLLTNVIIKIAITLSLITLQ